MVSRLSWEDEKSHVTSLISPEENDDDDDDDDGSSSSEEFIQISIWYANRDKDTLWQKNNKKKIN